MRLPTIAVALACLAGPASADSYPRIVVDRPLVLLPDMTEADVGVDFPTYLVGSSSHTALGKYQDIDISLHHAFGPVQVGAGFLDDIKGPIIAGGPRMMVGPGAVDLDVLFRVPTEASQIDHQSEQDLRYTVKAIVVPSALAVYGGGGLALDEYGVTYDPQLSSDRVLAHAGAGVEVQLVPELNASLGASATIPLDPTTNVHNSFAAGGQLTYAIDRFDVFASIWVYDLSKARLPYAVVGVAARFGG